MSADEEEEKQTTALDVILHRCTKPPSWFEGATKFNADNPLHRVGVRETFVISMGGERWQNAVEQLQLPQCGFKRKDFEVWPAVDGRLLVNDANNGALLKHIVAPVVHLQLDRQRDDSALYALDKPGHIGCSLSHIAIWQHVADRQLPAVLVLEDDVEPSRGANSILHNARCATLQQYAAQLVTKAGGVDQFDVLWLTYMSAFPAGGAEKKRPWRKEAEQNQLWQTFGPGWCTQAYIVTLKGARTLLEHAFPLCMTIDRYMYVRQRMPLRENQSYVMLRPERNLFRHPVANMFSTSTIGYNLDANTLLAPIPRNVIAGALIGMFILLIVLAIVVTVTLVKNRRLAKSLELTRSTSDITRSQPPRQPTSG